MKKSLALAVAVGVGAYYAYRTLARAQRRRRAAASRTRPVPHGHAIPHNAAAPAAASAAAETAASLAPPRSPRDVPTRPVDTDRRVFPSAPRWTDIHPALDVFTTPWPDPERDLSPAADGDVSPTGGVPPDTHGESPLRAAPPLAASSDDETAPPVTASSHDPHPTPGAQDTADPPPLENAMARAIAGDIPPPATPACVDAPDPAAAHEASHPDSIASVSPWHPAPEAADLSAHVPSSPHTDGDATFSAAGAAADGHPGEQEASHPSAEVTATQSAPADPTLAPPDAPEDDSSATATPVHEALRVLEQLNAALEAIEHRRDPRDPAPSAPATRDGEQPTVGQGRFSVAAQALGNRHVMVEEIAIEPPLEFPPRAWSRGETAVPDTLVLDLDHLANCRREDVEVVMSVGHQPTTDRFFLRVVGAAAGPVTVHGRFRVTAR